MSKLLLLSLFLLSVGTSGLVASAAENPSFPDRSGVPVHRVTPETPTDFDHMQINNNQDRDNVCLNIHAFIFQTDDDRVPRLIRETTCMPASSTAAKRVKGSVQPKLVPSAGGNSFSLVPN
jgi:hypothetical protein